MLRQFMVTSGIGVVTLTVGCSLFPDLGGLASDGGFDATKNDSGLDSGPVDATTDSGADSGADSGSADSGSDGSVCTCTNLVSAYRFSDSNNLGLDFFGANDMTTVHGSPVQSTTTPPGFTGHSIELDGSSTVCIDTGFTFDSTSDHTLCWWSQPAALANGTNQFAQYCGYDTWTANSGADYLWRINNCNGGIAANLQVASVYSIGQWTQICQTYTRSTLKRTVMINGQLNKKFSVTDANPIVESPTSSPWCIGSYGTGGFWTGLIYLPMWFGRVLSDTEMQQVYATACCLP